ncbi:MAG: hypothetical protein R2845_15160 [Thermomicrobiales bacterium]
MTHETMRSLDGYRSGSGGVRKTPDGVDVRVSTSRSARASPDAVDYVS